ncbi:hypothetical protein LDL08_19980 [Nonomuraea glycinis]|uniref:hypothetical protein n=1 Tax=Nonomuraea glycinis TaxID=2047744 RepID=UPI0016684AB7|nr:hypothetical protein [Nonomuraea glycinis]MCA2178472.1 hypothetical protein [Nonomuraea glycinis]
MAVLVSAAIAVTACQSGDSVPEPSSTAALSATPAPTPSPTSDKEAILAAYREVYRTGPLAERAQPQDRRAILKPVATQPLLGTMLKGIAALRAQGRVTWGQPVFHIFEVDIRGDGALLRDCQDARKAGQADDRTGKRLTHGMPHTYMVAALAKEADGMWRVAKMTQLTEPCSPVS